MTISDCSNVSSIPEPIPIYFSSNLSNLDPLFSLLIVVRKRDVTSSMNGTVHIIMPVYDVQYTMQDMDFFFPICN